MSKIIASVLVAVLSMVGITVSDSWALEAAMVALNLGSLVVAYVSRVRMGGITWYGKRQAGAAPLGLADHRPPGAP